MTTADFFAMFETPFLFGGHGMRKRMPARIRWWS
jgi:hypothetical protein